MKKGILWIGRIVSVGPVTPFKATTRGLMPTLVTPEETLQVHPGPTRYSENRIWTS